MIARLLHIANSCPPANKARRERFYAMKQRILRWFGTEDGYDLQYIPGKQCFNCDGTGEVPDLGGCYKCDGDGWFKSPVWVVLKRWKFGKYSFHEPVQRLYREPDTNSHDRPIIKSHVEGYIEHVSYSWNDVQRARLILSLLFDWRLLWSETDSWRIRRLFANRCHICKRRLWSLKKWQCTSCQHVKTFLGQDSDIPF